MSVKGLTIGGFEILDELSAGYGAQGMVYRAVCVEDKFGFVEPGTVVALKSMNVNDDQGAQWRKLEKRTRELVALEHPNVVRYYGCFDDDSVDMGSRYVLVQEYLSGETLKTRLARSPLGLDMDTGLTIVRAAVAGLDAACRAGIVHRDVKPGNIFLCDDGTVKLIDFELAKHESGTITASTGAGNMRGTLDYMAPDFMESGFDGDETSDVFSMGVVMHEVLTGRVPFHSFKGDERLAQGAYFMRWQSPDPINISKRVKNFLRDGDAVLRMALSVDRSKRCSTFAQFSKALARVSFKTLTSPSHVYRLVQYIGQGGFGEVLKARIEGTRQTVAIKRLHNAKYDKLFEREKNVLQKLGDDRFVQFVDYFEKQSVDGKSIYLVMLYLDGMPGSSLRDAIHGAKGEKLEWRAVFIAFWRYASGLDYLHKIGTFHRDIKPSNLYFPVGDPEKSAIMDLGIARDIHGSLSQGKVPGTPDYMPPEIVFLEDRGNAASDIYSLGLCLYEALTGKLAYPRLPSGGEYAELIRRFKAKKRPSFDDEDVASDPVLLKLLRSMTDINAGKRLADAGVVAETLSWLLGERYGYDVKGYIVEPTRLPPTAETPAPAIDWGRVAGVGGVAAAVVLLASIFFARGAILRWKSQKELQCVVAAFAGKDGGAPAKADLAAAEKIAAKWSVDWNPAAAGLFKLDSDAYSAGMERIAAARSNAIRDADKEMLYLPECISPELAEKAAQLRKEAEVLIGRFEPVAEYKAGLAIARRKISEAEDIQSAPNEDLRLRTLANDRAAWLVACVSNACPFEIVVNRQRIESGNTGLILVKTPDVSSLAVTAAGFQSANIEALLDGETRRVDPSLFKALEEEVYIPDPGNGVRCYVDGLARSPGKLMLAHGRHVCRYERDDYIAQGDLEFSVGERDRSLPAAREWQPADALLKLQQARGLELRGDWRGITNLLGKAALRDAANRAEAQRLYDMATEELLKAFRSEEDRRSARRRSEEEQVRREAEQTATGLAAEARELALKIEPLGGRSARLAEAEKMLDEADRHCKTEAAGKVRNEIAKLRSRLVAKIENKASFEIYVNGEPIPPGSSKVVDVEKDGAAKLTAKAIGRLDCPLAGLKDGEAISLYARDFPFRMVNVSVPRLANGVRCFIDEKAVESGAQALAPGRHVCRYERDDWDAQEFSFDASDGVPQPGAWKMCEALLKLEKAERALKERKWRDTVALLSGVVFESKANAERAKAIVATANNELSRLDSERRKAAENTAIAARLRDEARAAIDALEPVETRQTRLDEALRKLDEAARLSPNGEESQTRKTIEARKKWLVVKIVNNAPFDITAAGKQIAANSADTLAFTGGRTSASFVEARGFDKIPLVDLRDGQVCVFSKSDFKLSAIIVDVPDFGNDVVCKVDGVAATSGSGIPLSPGAHRLQYLRPDHNAQEREFKVSSDSHHVPAPADWRAFQSDALKALEQAVEYLQDGLPEDAMEAISGKRYELAANTERAQDLQNRARAEIAEKIRELATTYEALRDRRRNLESARRKLDAAKKYLLPPDYASLENVIKAQMAETHVRVINDCAAPLKIGSTVIESGGIAIVRFTDAEFKSATAKIDGYRAHPISSLNLKEGPTRIFTERDFTPELTSVSRQALPADVRLKIDGKIVEGKKIDLASGRHAYVYEKDDHVSEGGEIWISGKTAEMPAPPARFAPSPALARLGEARKANDRGDWRATTNLLCDVSFASAVNRAEANVILDVALAAIKAIDTAGQYATMLENARLAYSSGQNYECVILFADAKKSGASLSGDDLAMVAGAYKAEKRNCEVQMAEMTHFAKKRGREKPRNYFDYEDRLGRLKAAYYTITGKFE